MDGWIKIERRGEEKEGPKHGGREKTLSISNLQ